MSPNRKSNIDVCSHLFQKYAEIRALHKKTAVIEKDFEIVKDHTYFYLTVSCIHYTSFYKLLNIFKDDATCCASMYILNPMKLVRYSDCLLTYDKALELKDKFNIDINVVEQQNSWVYDMLLFQKNTLYIHEKLLHKLYVSEFGDIVNLDTFCSKFQIGQHAYITLTEFYNMELELGDRLLDLYHTKKNKHTCNISEYISSYQEKNNIKLTKQQTKAISYSIENKLSIICGYPGTGKSTIAKAVCDYFKGESICLLAPTGMAVNNLRLKCSHISSQETLIGTIHKMIYDQFEKIPKIDLMIVDEFSMVDIFLFHKLMKWCEVYDCKLLILADDQQLSPVQAGFPLGAFIASGIFKINKLTKIKRQEKGLLKDIILRFGNDNLVDPSCFDDKTVHFYNYSRKNVLKVKKTFNLTNTNSKFITPQHKHDEGTVNINTILQESQKHNNLIYPSYKRVGPRIFEGDMVVRIVNDYKNDALYANGDIGIVKKQDGTIVIEYIGSELKQVLTNDELYEDFQLAYCLTIHKVQGSQYETIVLIMGDNHQYSWTKNDAKKLLYTAISRAEKRCIILGNPNLFVQAQKEKSVNKPTFFLKHFHQYNI